MLRFEPNNNGGDCGQAEEGQECRPGEAGGVEAEGRGEPARAAAADGAPLRAVDVPAGLTADEWAAVRKAVRYRADRLARTLPPDAPHTAEDLEAEGLLAALASLARFDRGRALQPDTFLVPRAVGAMLDAVRQFNAVVRVPRAEFGGRTRRTFAASGVWHDPIEWRTSGEPNGRSSPLSISVWFAEPSTPPVELDDGPRVEFRRAVRRAFGRLTPAEEDALVSYFHDDRTMEALADAEGVSESRISQRIRAAVRELKSRGIDRHTAGACLAGHRRG